MEKKNIRQTFISLFSGGKGRVFWNYCYSWGASLVIIGAMFKIMHFPYANQILIIALSVEALVFFVSAFDYNDNQSSINKTREDIQPVGFPEPFYAIDSDAGGDQMKEYIRQQQLLTDHLKILNQLYENSLPDHAVWQTEVKKMIVQLKELNRFNSRLLDTLNKQSPENPFTHV